MSFDEVQSKLKNRQRWASFFNKFLPEFITDYLLDFYVSGAEKIREKRQEGKDDLQKIKDIISSHQDNVNSVLDQCRGKEKVELDLLKDTKAQVDDILAEIEGIREKIDMNYLLTEEFDWLEETVDEASQIQQRLKIKIALEKDFNQLRKIYLQLKKKIKPYREFYTYLTSKKKSKLYQLINKGEDIIFDIESYENPALFSGADEERFQDAIELFLDQKEFLEVYNKKFMEKRIEEHQDLFTDIDEEGHDLTDEQLNAVIKDDKHNLLIAGAGSGKTVTLTYRIAYLIKRRDKINPENILAITFTNQACRVMEKRLEKQFGITAVNVSTFHSLGYKFLNENSDNNLDIFAQDDQLNFIRDIIEVEEGKENSEFKSNYYGLLQNVYDYEDEEADETDFEEKEEWHQYLKEKKYITLRQEEVKSKAEKAIADFLFLHQVDYQYESMAEWAPVKDEKGRYFPDFYLPEYDIYIEHWGIREKGQVSESFSLSSEEYRDGMRWKRELFQNTDGYRLVETYDFEYASNFLKDALSERLNRAGVRLKKMKYKEFVNSTFDYKRYKEEILDLFRSFLANARVQGLTPKQIRQRLEKNSEKEKYFYRCACHILREYEDYLDEKNLIDFSDMLHQATDFINKNPDDFSDFYDQILVDEFQDVSDAEVNFLKSLVTPENGTKIFCVGDDWQSIYAFKGSDVSYFINFEDHFSDPTKSFLTHNYRCSKSIVETGNTLIANNENQIDKEVKAHLETGRSPSLHVLNAKDEGHFFNKQNIYIADLIEEACEEGVSPENIMVLARVNFLNQNLESFLGRRGIPVENEQQEGVKLYSGHQAKGEEAEHVIISNVSDSQWGFPCKVEDRDLLEPVRLNTEDNLAEERRLFYVAITRAEKRLDIIARKNNLSPFIEEIEDKLDKVKSLKDYKFFDDKKYFDELKLKVTHVEMGKNSKSQKGFVSDGRVKIRFVVWKDTGIQPLEKNKTYLFKNCYMKDISETRKLYLDSNSEVKKLDK